MSDQVQSISYREVGLDTQARNRVLRNTYWLLSLTLIPTVLGAWVGVETGLSLVLSGGMGLVVFIIGLFGFIYAIEKTKDTAMGIAVLLAFTFFMGLMMSRLIAMILGKSIGYDCIWWHCWCVFPDGEPCHGN